MDLTLLTPYLVPLASAVIGYLLRHYGVAIPGLPTAAPTAPAVPVVAPATASAFDEILKLLTAFRAMQNPATPTVPALTVSTPTHNVTVGADGTNVSAK